ncbi:MAG: peroxiredoxin [Planctomycetaceae bacterium]|nr:peroxiredoxin [Planctomycetaceae bacterium]
MYLFRFASVASLSLILITNTIQAEETKETVELKVGDPAPSFTLLDDQGNEWKSDEHYGQKIVVIYFYPADMTPGCTKQACGFRDNLAELAGEGVEVVGISGDTVKNHQLFKKAHNLNFTLLADEDAQAAAAFGVPHREGESVVKALIEGKEELLPRDVTISRWTFVVGKDKTIKLKNEQVNAAQDSQEILEVIDSLKN